MRTLKFICIAALIVCFAYAQQRQGPQPRVDMDFSHDPCGNPLVESQLFLGVEGKVIKVVDGRTLLMSVPGLDHTLRVRLIAVNLETGGGFNNEAQAYLQRLAAGNVAELLVDPFKWEKKPHNVTGVVHVKGSSDASLSLLSEGLVRFSEPAPYSMSRYTQCQYRRAEAEAKSKRLGLWGNPVRK